MGTFKTWEGFEVEEGKVTHKSCRSSDEIVSEGSGSLDRGTRPR